MRKIIIFAFILGLAVFSAGAHSRANGSPQWVTGRVVSIVKGTDGSLLSMELPGGEVVSMERGPTDSLLSVRMSDGTVFNVAASNDKIKGIKVGDHVIAKVFQGWAQSVTKK